MPKTSVRIMVDDLCRDFIVGTSVADTTYLIKEYIAKGEPAVFGEGDRSVIYGPDALRKAVIDVYPYDEPTPTPEPPPTTE